MEVTVKITSLATRYLATDDRYIDVQMSAKDANEFTEVSFSAPIGYDGKIDDEYVLTLTKVANERRNPNPEDAPV